MEWIETIKRLQRIDLAQLDYENPSKWPKIVRQTSYILALLFGLLLGVGIFSNGSLSSLNQLRQKEDFLKETYKTKILQTSMLDVYQTRLAKTQQSFQRLLDQLPESTEIPGLLEAISQSSAHANLKLNSMAIEPEFEKGDYIVLPIRVQVSGDYHSFGLFLARIANLARIVTVHDVLIKPAKAENVLEIPGKVLTMELMVQTYHYKKAVTS